MFIYIKQILHLCRIKQYIKNGFIFLPIIFATKALYLEKLAELGLSFIAFSLVTSAVYIFNDLIDLKKDQLHPVKKKRPLASGQLSKRSASFMALCLLVLGFWLGSCIHVVFIYITCIYVVINLLYTLRLKHFAMIDLLLVSFGFVLRVILGGSIAQVLLSEWIILMTFLLAFFLITSKRYIELSSFNSTEQKNIRPSLTKYNPKFLIICMSISATLVIMGYLMYTLQAAVSPYFYASSLFVIWGIFRYLQLIFLVTDCEDPSTILNKDYVLQSIILLWFITIILFLYF